MVRYLMQMHYVYSGTNPTEATKWTRKRRENANLKMEKKLAEPALEPASRPPSRNGPAGPAHRLASRNRSRNTIQQRNSVHSQSEPAPSRKNRLTDRPAGAKPERTGSAAGPAELTAEILSLRTDLGLMPRNIPFRCYLAPPTIYTPLAIQVCVSSL